MSADFVSGYISFPGVSDPISMTATRILGMRPSVALIYATPQGDTPDCSGTATFQFGTSSNVMTWNNALCDSSSLQVSESGHRQVFVIYDRRWRWSKGLPVTGAYNVRKPDGTIDAATQKTLAELATILFTAMNESGADVSAITSTEYPMVVFDRDNPSDQLAQLLEPRGYVVSLMQDDSVVVFARGTGTPLPDNDDLINANLSVDPPEIPFAIRLICNRTLVQSMLATVPVGLDVDGSIVGVNDLSYLPSGGWDGKDLIDFTYITDPVARECAKLSVGKWYQVSTQADGTQNISFDSVDYCPGEISITNISQILPLQDFILVSATDRMMKVRYQPAFVSGVFWDTGANPLANPPTAANTPAFTVVRGRDWTLNKQYGIVQFRESVTKDNAGTKTFADVFLTCCYSVHDATVQVKDRYERDLTLGGYGYDTRHVDELQRTLIVAYTSGTSTVSGITDNKSSVNSDADLYLNAAAAQYVTQQSNVLMYRDCYGFNTDGVTWQLQWNVASHGHVVFGTMASQYAENLYLLPTAAQAAYQRGPRLGGDPTNKAKKKYNKMMFGESAPRGGGLGFN